MATARLTPRRLAHASLPADTSDLASAKAARWLQCDTEIASGSEHCGERVKLPGRTLALHAPRSPWRACSSQHVRQCEAVTIWQHVTSCVRDPVTPGLTTACQARPDYLGLCALRLCLPGTRGLLWALTGNAKASLCGHPMLEQWEAAGRGQSDSPVSAPRALR